jgi:hypothetical protein
MKQLLELSSLAKKYAEIGKELAFAKNDHNYIRSDKSLNHEIFKTDYNTLDNNKPEIRLYFSGGYDTYCLDYGIEYRISIWSINKVELPIEITESKLEEVIHDLSQHLLILRDMTPDYAAIRTRERIAILEKEIEELKKS